MYQNKQCQHDVPDEFNLSPPFLMPYLDPHLPRPTRRRREPLGSPAHPTASPSSRYSVRRRTWPDSRPKSASSCTGSCRRGARPRNPCDPGRTCRSRCTTSLCRPVASPRSGRGSPSALPMVNTPVDYRNRLDLPRPSGRDPSLSSWTDAASAPKATSRRCRLAPRHLARAA